MAYFYLLKSVPSMIMLMTIQCHIRHRCCKAFCQVYSITAKSPLSGLVIMEWKRTLQNSNLWFVTKPNWWHRIEIGREYHTKTWKISQGPGSHHRQSFDVEWSYWCCCIKDTRQLNALVRISKYFDPKSKRVLYNSFIRSNFEYCPLVWHFCGKTNDNKLEKIQEWSLRILHDSYELSYEELSNKMVLTPYAFID